MDYSAALHSPGSGRNGWSCGSPAVETPSPSGETAGQPLKLGPSSPGTPGCCPDGAALDPKAAQWLSHLHARLHDWLDALRRLHPACQHIPQESAALAIGLFREWAAQTGLSFRFAAMQPLILGHTLGACLWASIKFLTNPGAVPNAPFMARATGLQANMLVAFEPEVMRAVDWRLLAIAQAVGLDVGPQLSSE